MFEQSNFDNAAPYYDLFELKSQKMYAYILEILEKHFSSHGAHTILDLACGTGAQAIPLAQKGYQVTACDLSASMLEIAQRKAGDLQICFCQGDMRSSYFGSFDAVIAIFNSVGYLSRADFLSALKNIRRQTRNEKGLFIFDNTNRNALAAGQFSTGRRLDTVGEADGKKFVRFFQSDFDRVSGVMTMDWEAHVQQDPQPMETFRGTWHRQTYTVEEMEQILNAAGFRVLECYDRYGGVFQKEQSFSVLVVAEAQ